MAFDDSIDAAPVGLDDPSVDATVENPEVGRSQLRPPGDTAATAPEAPAPGSRSTGRNARTTALEEPDFEHMLTSHLLGFGRAVSKHFEALLAQSDVGLTSAQARVILKLHYDGSMTQKALAEGTDVAPPTLARTLDIMERDGLVSRVRNPEDRREVRVELTDGGRDRLPGLFELFRAAEAWLTDGLSSKRVARLLDELSVVKERLAGYLPCCGNGTPEEEQSS